MFPRKPLGFLIFAALAAAAAAFVWFGLPHDREVKSLGLFLVKLLPFVFATEALARLDVDWAKRLRLPLLLLPVAFLVFFLYFVPKIFFYGGAESGTKEAFYALYYHVLTLTPLIILSLVLAHRLGGGTAALTRRLSYGMLLLMLSGLEDLAFLTVNEHTDPAYATIPAVWDWASHMTVFLGHPASKYEAYAFIAVHLVIAALVLFAPAAWFRRLDPRRKPAAVAAVAEREPVKV